MIYLSNYSRKEGAERLKKRLDIFFKGRYGNDQLGIFMTFCAMILYFFSLLIDSIFFAALTMGILICASLRMYSRDISARQCENQRYLKGSAPYWNKLNLFVMSCKDRSHRYLCCPYCGKSLRVPKGKGKITVHCSCCNQSFLDKS